MVVGSFFGIVTRLSLFIIKNGPMNRGAIIRVSPRRGMFFVDIDTLSHTC